MEANFWEATQELLQGDNPLVRKPKLSETLLKKPPFRFLHDVITEVQSATGFAPGLFEGIETEGKAIQDRDTKISYLQKIFETVSIALQEPVNAKPNKVIAGLEPEETNLFLQQLARAALQGDGHEAVQVVLQQRAAAAPPPVARSAERWSLPPEKEPQPQQPPPARPPPALLPAPAPLPAPAYEAAAPSSQAAPEPASALPEAQAATAAGDLTSSQARPPSRPSSQREQRPSTPLDLRRRTSEASAAPVPARQAALPPQPQQPARPAAEVPGPRVPRDPDVERGGSAAAVGPSAGSVGDAPFMPVQQPAMPPRMERPQSARRPPPRIPNPAMASGMATDAGRKPSELGAPGLRPGTASRNPAPPGRPGSAMRGPSPAVALLEEGAAPEDDEDDVVVVPAVAAGLPEPLGVRRTGAGAENVAGGQHGALVRDILEAEKNLEGAAAAAAGPGEPEAGQATGIIIRRNRKAGGQEGGGGGGVKASDVEGLRALVQKLCQDVNALGKCISYLQGDLDTQASELRYWTNECRVYQEKLRGSQPDGEEEAGWAAQLAAADEQIREAHERIDGTKAQILGNDDTVQRLLHLVLSSGS